MQENPSGEHPPPSPNLPISFSWHYGYISEVGGGSLAHPTGKSFRFVRACVRAVLVKSFRNEKVHGAPCIFYLFSREVVSFICCDFGFFVNSHWFRRDFWRVLVSYQWVLMSLNEFSESAIKFYWFLVSSSEVSVSSHEFSVSSCEFYWVLVRPQWVPMSSQWVLVSSTEF